MGYSLRLAARVLLYASSNIQDNTKHQSWSTCWNEKWLSGSTMKDRSDDPSHHERTLPVYCVYDASICIYGELLIALMYDVLKTAVRVTKGSRTSGYKNTDILHKMHLVYNYLSFKYIYLKNNSTRSANSFT